MGIHDVYKLSLEVEMTDNERKNFYNALTNAKCHRGQKISRVLNAVCHRYGVSNHPAYNRTFAQLSATLNPIQLNK